MTAYQRPLNVRTLFSESFRMMSPHWSYLTGAHAVRGATKEKSRKLDELKARRKAKDVKKKVRLLTISE